MESHSVTYHPAAVTFPPLPQPKLVLDVKTTGDARLSCSFGGYITKQFTRQKLQGVSGCLTQMDTAGHPKIFFAASPFS